MQIRSKIYYKEAINCQKNPSSGVQICEHIEKMPICQELTEIKKFGGLIEVPRIIPTFVVLCQDSNETVIWHTGIHNGYGTLKNALR